MQKLGKAIDLGPFMGKAKNRIFRVGVELEGGWTSLPKGSSGPIRDGSINHLPSPANGELLRAIGEIPSPPLLIDGKQSTEGGGNLYNEWITAYYPHSVNETCGMHVHMSLTSALTYQRLMDPRYPGTIVAYMKLWAEKEGLGKEHPIWPRLAGRNEYCQHVFQADDQAVKADKEYNHHAHGHRYTVVNYCYTRNSTVEVRLLPMFATSEVAIRAVEEILKVTNAYLLATAKKERKAVGSAVADEVELKSHKQIVVR